MNSGETNNVFKIVEEIVDLTPEERADLSGFLEKTSLSNIISMQKLVIDRLQAIQDLRALVFDHKKFSNEIDHIQKFIELHYWIFGEQYHLVTAEEPNFEEALRRYLYILRGEDNPKGTIKIDSEHSKKQMDIFAVQQLISGEVKKAIVVELKRPSVMLSQKELDQLKTYYSVIKKEDRFAASNIEWEFILVGNGISEYIKDEITTNKNHGEKGLVRNAGGCKIYVKTWSEIFTELEINFNFLNEKLKLDQKKLIKRTGQTSDEIIIAQQSNVAKAAT